MRILITGGAGFIGSHIVDACLAAGHEPFVIDDLSSGSRANIPDSVPLFVADICDGPRVAAIFGEVRPDAVSHQAAQLSVSRSVREPVFDAQVNVLGLLNVCTQALRVGVRRLVFASSGGVLYGDVFAPAKEDAPANPISPYGISKWAGERYLQFFVREHGISAVALRYANVYGPRQNPHGEAGVVAIFCQRLLCGESATINGDGKYDRDYVYGPDVAQANLRAIIADRPAGFAAFNIGTGIATDVNQLASAVKVQVETVRAQRGQPGSLPALQNGPARAGDLRSSLVDAGLAARELGWTPQTPLADGLRKTVAWFAEQASDTASA
ncbi:MAG TPA: NAD-dependent epimerase/dehydratase family protein [Planctomycetaceae bacterium]|nr:NAD-dependent epimerase/dehydratase family protein [Planctomycetaceae bacterium]